MLEHGALELGQLVTTPPRMSEDAGSWWLPRAVIPRPGRVVNIALHRSMCSHRTGGCPYFNVLEES